jgi:hypothetical protein
LANFRSFLGHKFSKCSCKNVGEIERRIFSQKSCVWRKKIGEIETRERKERDAKAMKILFTFLFIVCNSLFSPLSLYTSGLSNLFLSRGTVTAFFAIFGTRD